MKGIVDTHTHLESFVRKGLLEGTLAAAEEAGVGTLVTIGTDVDDWGLYADLADRFGQVQYTVGIHPCSVGEGWESSCRQIAGFWERATRPVGLGEIGLDRFHLPKEAEAAEQLMGWQKAAFAAQLEIAKALDCPVVVHSRGAFAECVELIDRSGVDWRKVVFHCFVEGPEAMRQLLERGGYGSFTGVITFKSAEVVREAARVQGLDRLMIETDAPYLAPMPHRGKPNEPAYLAYTARFCAGLFGVSEEEFARRTAAVSRAFYGLV